MIRESASPSEDAAHLPGEAPEPLRFDARDLDPTANPRTDLDAFVNARWRAAHPVPPDRSCWDSFTVLGERALCAQAAIAAKAAATTALPGSAERIVGDFWSSGLGSLDASGLDLLCEELARIDALETPASIAAYIRERHASGSGVLFQFDVGPDFEDPEQSIACISQAGLGLPDRDDYFDASPHGIARRRAYLAHIAATLELAGTRDATSISIADDVLAFETRLAGASTSRRVLARDISARFRPVDIDAADRASPQFPWSRFFHGIGVAVPRRFSLAMPAFNTAVNDALRSAPPDVWRTYLRYHTVDEAAPYLGAEFIKQHHRFHGEALRGRKSPAPRWKRVIEAIDAHVGEAMGQLYVAHCFPPESKEQIHTIAEQLRNALRARLENNAWMGETTRRAALDKLASLTFKIGFPERWRDWSGLLTTRDSLYANVLAARRFEQYRRTARIGRPTDRSLWPMPPQSVNAGYDPQRNEIVFPAAILAPPFFDPAADEPLNYGGIGAVIAHEMIHGYDDQGSRFGAAGRFEDWWTPEDRERFEALALRMIQRFERLPVSAGEPVDGHLTLGENIADFGGLAVACDALRNACSDAGSDPILDGYTRMQRFFLGWAVLWRQNLTLGEAYFRLKNDPHAPANVRANAAPANLAAYAEAFDCKPGDPMYADREDRIDLW